jgi:hypothetical protein
VLRSSFDIGVGHEPNPLPDVWRACAVCAKYGSPDGVTFCFQVCRNQIEPTSPNRCFNLFSKDRCRDALADKSAPFEPQMPLIVSASALSGNAKWLTGARTRPDGPIIGPACEAQRVAPSPDSGEEMALGKSHKVIWLDIYDAPGIDHARRNRPGTDQVFQPFRGVWIIFVIIGYHQQAPAVDIGAGRKLALR